MISPTTKCLIGIEVVVPYYPLNTVTSSLFISFLSSRYYLSLTQSQAAAIKQAKFRPP